MTFKEIKERCAQSSLNLVTRKKAVSLSQIHRGYYTVAQRYVFYFRVVNTIFYELAQRVSEILFLTQENKIHIFKPPCNFLFGQTAVKEREMTSSISSLVRIWKIRDLVPGRSFI